MLTPGRKLAAFASAERVRAAVRASDPCGTAGPPPILSDVAIASEPSAGGKESSFEEEPIIFNVSARRSVADSGCLAPKSASLVLSRSFTAGGAAVKSPSKPSSGATVERSLLTYGMGGVRGVRMAEGCCGQSVHACYH
uniref:Uncharacterized protein n=1 Tax=Phaeomonas parva TaxID=124430 RepID=A0A7S1Y1B3_9STRA